MDGKLHFAPLSDKIEKAVDIGTGTGIWAMCVHLAFSSDHLIIDIIFIVILATNILTLK